VPALSKQGKAFPNARHFLSHSTLFAIDGKMNGVNKQSFKYYAVIDVEATCDRDVIDYPHGNPLQFLRSQFMS